MNSTVLNSTVVSPSSCGAPCRSGTPARQEWIWQGRKDSNPRMSESKSDALTNLATPLHRSRLAPRTSKPVSAGPAPQRMLVQAAAHPTHPAVQAPCSCGDRRHGADRPTPNSCEDRAARTRHAAVAATGLQPAGGLRHLGTTAPARRAARSIRSRIRLPNRPVAAASVKRAREYNSASVAASPGGAKTCAVASAAGGLTTAKRIGGSAIGVSCSPMPSTKALSPPTKNGTSAPSVAAEREQLRRGPAQTPQPVQRQQRGRRVGAAAAQAGAPRHAACRSRCRRRGCCRWPLQRARRAQAQVVGRQWRAQVVALQPAVVARLEVQRVGPVDQHEHRLQQVVAVVAPADHVQEQVQLGRRRHVVQRAQASSRRPGARARSSAGSGRALRAQRAVARTRPGRPASRAVRSPRPRGRLAAAGHGRPRSQSGSARQRQRLAERFARQRVEVGETTLAVGRDQHGRLWRPARDGQRRPEGRAQPQFAAFAIAAQVEGRAHRLRGTLGLCADLQRQPAR